MRYRETSNHDKKITEFNKKAGHAIATQSHENLIQTRAPPSLQNHCRFIPVFPSEYLLSYPIFLLQKKEQKRNIVDPVKCESKWRVNCSCYQIQQRVDIAKKNEK